MRGDAPETPVPSPASVSPEEERFAREARAVGLSLPRPARANIWISMAIVAVVVSSALGIGLVTGWTDLGSSSGGGIPLLYGPQNCGPTPAVLYGSLDPSVHADFGTWLSSNAARIVATLGGCLEVSLNSSGGTGAGSDPLGPSVNFAAATSVPANNVSATNPQSEVFYPAAIGAVEVVYDLPGVPAGLVLNATVLAGLFDGAITSWDAAPIQALNPALQLGGQPPVSVVYQEGASDASAVLSGYLARGDSTWAANYGSGPSIRWPVGVGVANSTAAAALVSSTPGAIGYVELLNASTAAPSGAAIVNPEGTAVVLSPANVTAAATVAGSVPAVGARDWPGVSTLDAAGEDSYPLVAMTYLGLYADLGLAYSGHLSLTNATWLMTLLWWVFESNAYVPLPVSFTAPAQSVLTNVTYDGKVILQVQDSENGENGGETGEF